MSAQPWKFYNRAKHHFGAGVIDMDGTTFDMHLFTSASDFAVGTQSTLGELSGEVASGNGYTRSGKPMTVTWTIGASASEMRFAAANLIWTGSGGSIANIKGAVIIARTGASGKDTANKLLAYASLSSGQFTIVATNTLSLTSPPTGIFELN